MAEKERDRDDQKRVLGKKAYQQIWDKSWDVSQSLSTLGEHYISVPDELKDIKISVMTVIQISEEDMCHIERIKAWDQGIDYSNAKDFLKGK